jgi:hypothetical protein
MKLSILSLEVQIHNDLINLSHVIANPVLCRSGFDNELVQTLFLIQPQLSKRVLTITAVPHIQYKQNCSLFQQLACHPRKVYMGG